ncbi:MAG: AAA family ATPase [Blautia massiliensis (ex Durand et al. 2017)]
MNELLWHFSRSQNMEDIIPEFLRQDTLYTGRYRDSSNNTVRSALHIGATSAKLTHGFAWALSVASGIDNGTVTNCAYGRNTINAMCEVCDENGEANSHLVFYNLNTHKLTSTRDEKSSKVYLLAIWQQFLELVPGFFDLYNEYCTTLNNGGSEEVLQKNALLMADLAYYTTSATKPTIEVDESVKVIKRNTTMLNREEYIPSIKHGIFHYCKQSEKVTEHSKTVSADSFVGKYHFGHTLTEEEQSLVPVLPDNESPLELTASVCKMICDSTTKARKVRNVLLYGPTGTGKSTMAKHIAAGLGLPYVTLNCNADTTIMDLLVQCMPADNSSDTLDVSIEGVPSVDDMLYDPEAAWTAMTGKEKIGVEAEKCMSLAYEKITGEKKDLTVSEYCSFIIKRSVEAAQSKNGKSFMYVESPLVKAVRNGWVIELQEPTTIVQAGVLPGLNSLLDADGQIFLPNGEVVHRHPDCIVVATTNLNYQGCRAINQSFLRRFQFKAIVKNPTGTEELVRLKNMVGYDKSDYVSVEQMMKMLDVAKQIKEKCDELDLTEGDIGICEVADWVNAANMIESIRLSANYTIIPSATQDSDAIEQMEDIVAQKFVD